MSEQVVVYFGAIDPAECSGDIAMLREVDGTYFMYDATANKTSNTIDITNDVLESLNLYSISELDMFIAGLEALRAELISSGDLTPYEVDTGTIIVQNR